MRLNRFIGELLLLAALVGITGCSRTEQASVDSPIRNHQGGTPTSQEPDELPIHESKSAVQVQAKASRNFVPSQFVLSDWALTTAAYWPKKYSVSEQSTSINITGGELILGDGVSSEATTIAYRKRLTGDFSIDFRLAPLPDANGNRIAGEFVKVGFIRENGARLLVPLAIGPAARSSTLPFRITRENGVLYFAAIGQGQGNPIANGVLGPGYIALEVVGQTKVAIKRFEIDGESDGQYFQPVKLERQVVNSPRKWTVYQQENAKDDSLIQVSAKGEGLVIEGQGNAQHGHVTFDQPLQGDFVVKMNLSASDRSALNQVSYSLVRGDEKFTNRQRVLPEFDSGVATVLVTRIDGTIHFRGGQSSSQRFPLKGPVRLRLYPNHAQSPISVDELSWYVDAKPAMHPAAASQKHQDGWSFSPAIYDLDEATSKEFKLSSEDKARVDVALATGRRASVPVVRALNTKDDFQATCRIEWPAADSVANGSSYRPEFSVSISPKHKRYGQRDLEIKLPKPVDGKTTSHPVMVMRSGNAVTIVSGNNERTMEIYGELQLKMIARYFPQFTICDYNIGPLQIAPPREVALPGVVSSVEIAGGGRYMIMHSTQIGQLIVFDIEQEKVVQIADLQGNVMIAGCKDHFVVLNRDEQTLSRYRIDPFEKEATVAYKSEEDPVAIAMGSASAGPLLIVTEFTSTKGSLNFIELESLRPSALRMPAVKPRWKDRSRLRASRDGRLFVCSGSTGSYITLTGDEVKVQDWKGSMWDAKPGPLNQYVFTDSGVSDYDQNRVQRLRSHLSSAPATLGPFYVTLGPIPNDNSNKIRPELRHPSIESPIAMVRELRFDQSFRSSVMPVDERMIYHAGCQSLVVLSEPRNRLQIVDLDAVKAFQSNAPSDLAFVSQPKTTATPGSEYEYRVETTYVEGAVELSLASGPDGMELSPEGKLTWTIPRQSKTDLYQVVVAARLKNGKVKYHPFPIRVDRRLSRAPTMAIAIVGSRNAGRRSRSEGLPDKKVPGHDTSPTASIAASIAGKTQDNKDSVQAPNVDEPETVSLPAVFDHVAVAGGGRYFLFSFGGLKKVGIYDLRERKFT